MAWLAEMIFAVFSAIIVGGVMAYVLLRLVFHFPQQIQLEQSKVRQLTRRMDELDRRLNDIHDVLLSPDHRLAASTHQ